MIRFLVGRLFYALILLGIISIIAFYLSKLVPGDEVLDYLSIDDSRYSAASDPLEQRISYRRVAQKRGLDLPLFYLSVSPGYYPDTLNKIVPTDDRISVKHWVKDSKDQGNAILFYRDLMSGLAYACPRSDTQIIADQFCKNIHSILNNHDLYSIHDQIMQIHAEATRYSISDPAYSNIISILNRDIEVLITSSKDLSSTEWWPQFRWNGSENQYHQWISGFVTYRPLTSLVDGRNAWSKILSALGWTLLLNGLAFLVAIILGVAIGIWSGTHDGHWLERLINIKLFALYALPSFWLATLLIYFLSSGEWLTIFPSGGLGSYQGAQNIFESIGILASHLFLPVLCLALGSLAYVSRQMKQSVAYQMGQPYVLSLRTQGISEKTILRKHVIRNALFPLITLIGGSLPVLLSGSLIIEVIFSIPGMGRLMYTSLMARDWPVAFPILMFGATITVLSYILTDLVYKWADPRIKSMES